MLELWPRGLKKAGVQVMQAVQADVGPGLGVPSDFMSVDGHNRTWTFDRGKFAHCLFTSSFFFVFLVEGQTQAFGKGSTGPFLYFFFVGRLQP